MIRSSHTDQSALPHELGERITKGCRPIGWGYADLGGKRWEVPLFIIHHPQPPPLLREEKKGT